MTVLSLLGRMSKLKYEAWSAHKVAPVRTPAPLGLHQGSSVQISAVPMVLAQGDGAVFPDVDSNQMVISVGSFAMFGQRVFRSYLSDGRSYIQTVADAHDPAKSVETRLYTLHTETLPSNPSDIAFLLGSAGRSEWSAATGTNIVVEEPTPALIGWPLFQIDDAAKGPVLFPRLWGTGDAPASPSQANETLVNSDGNTFQVAHWMMQYGRVLGVNSTTSEFLIAEFIETAEGAAFNASVGVALDDTMLSVMASV